MNFFAAQDKARRKTGRLIFLFVLAVISLILLTNILLIGTFAYMEANEMEESISSLSVFEKYFELDVIIAVSIGVIALITLGSIYKIISLSKGGQAIAEMLGGQFIPQSTTNLEERRLLNIVEEMSIAAGMPIPKVYLLNESSINAFAAGQSHNNAVIGVTRGALSQLSRAELQGVIAHEFSHILNGDMRLNLRLIGILHGILLIGIIGEYIIRSIRHSSGNKKGNAGAIIFIGIGLMVIGYAGTFFGKWIKASVSRQREFLADASAVQFTRNKDTIAGALKKIGGSDHGSLLETPAAPEYSHAYFADGVSSFLGSIMATHPPLKDRIKQIDPTWNGQYIVPKPIKDEEVKTQKEKPTVVLPVTAAILTGLEQIMNQIGTVNETNIEYAHQLIQSLPETLRTASNTAYSARAMIYALLLREQKDKNKAWELLNIHADKAMPELTKELITASNNLDENLILPLLEFSINALRELSEKQYKQFKQTINEIITSDNTVDLNEWIIQRLVLQQLDEHFSLRKPAKAKYAYLGAVKEEAEILLSLIAYTEHKDDEAHAKQAFELGVKETGAYAFNFIPKQDLSLKSINRALDQLIQIKPLLKPRILKACAAIIMIDGKATRKGVELFRTIATCLDCPVPPLKL
ncbi:MAG: M48 family metallopeptidase [Gammaproteobacteria bacterium]|nr:M48 family metallopeptidase [Gammaproteobacteria bacterium]